MELLQGATGVELIVSTVTGNFCRAPRSGALLEYRDRELLQGATGVELFLSTVTGKFCRVLQEWSSS